MSNEPEIGKEMSKEEKLAGISDTAQNKVQIEQIAKDSSGTALGTPSRISGNNIEALENTHNSTTGKNTEPSKNLSEKYRLIALNTSDLIAFTTFDVDPVFTFVNPSYLKILGFEAEELLGKSWFAFIHQDDKQQMRRILIKYIDAKINGILTPDMVEEQQKLDFRILDKSGHWHFLHSAINMVNDELLFISKDITEKKHAEETLHRSEEMFSKAFRLSPESITLTSLKEGRYVDVNESFLHVIGYSRDEVIGRTATELNIWVDPNDRARFIQGLKERGSIRNLELRMRTKSGGVGTVLMSSEIINVNGEPCALTVTTNITDRKRTEETLQENEKRMKSIIQGLSIAAFVIDSDHRVLYWNKALEALSNIRAEEIIGTTNHWKAFYPQKRPCMGDILIDGGLNNIEKWYAGRYKKSSLLDESFEATDFFPNLGSDGKWLRFTATVIRNTNRDLIGVLETLEDISDHKKAEIALQESEEKYRSVFNNFVDLYYQTDMKGIITNVSPSCFVLFGWKPEELIGRQVLELYPDPEQRKPLLEKLLREGAVSDYEINLLNRDGRHLSVSVSSHLIRDEQGNPKCVEGTIRDISERKRVDEALRESENRHQVLFESSSDAVMTLEPPTWNFTTGNPATLKMFKAKNEADFISYGPGALSPERQPDGRASTEKAKEMIETAMRDGSCFFEWTHKRISGEDFSATVLLSKVEQGKKVFLQATVRDISERKRADEALRTSEERFRLAVSGLTDILYEWNIKTGSMQWFGKIDSLLGYENGTFPQTIEAFLKHVHPEDVNNVKEVATNGLQSHQKWQGEYRVLNKEGAELYCYGTGMGVYDQVGNPIKVVGAVTDITERKREEEALAQQNEVLSQLSRFSIELSMLSSEDNLEALIIKRIKEIAGAEVAIFSDYNSTNRTTTTKHIEMEPGLLEKVVGLLGTQVTKIHSVVTDEMYQQMTTEFIGFQKTLHEVSFGAISRPVAAAIQALLKVDRFIGLAYIINGKLYGTSILGMKKDQPDPPKQILENFIFIAAVSLRRKQAEEELRRSEEQYRLVTDNASDIIWTMDLNLRFTYFSPSNEKLTGYTMEKALTLSLDELLTPESMERALQSFTAQMEIENSVEKDLSRSVTLELNEKRADGTIFPVEVRMCFLRDAQNNPVGIIGITRDITERKTTEVVLATSERRYRSLYNNLRDGSAAVDLQGKIIECNNAFENMLGYSREELKSITFEEITPMKWHDIEKKILEEQVIRRGYSDLYEKEYRHKDGKIFPVELQTYAIRDNENQLCGFWAFIRDVTVRKQMELAQKESEEKYRSIVENTQDVIMLTGPDGRVSYMSPACVRVLEYNPDELVGKIPEIFYPDDIERVHNALSSAMQGVSGSNLEYRICTKNGKTKWVSHSWSPILTENHGLKCIASIVRDITESKIAEQLLRQKIEELEKYKSVTVNREVKMVDLKNEINELCKQLNQKPKYPSV